MGFNTEIKRFEDAICLIDCDPIKYAAGFGCEKRDPETELITVDPIQNLRWYIDGMIKRVIKNCNTRQYKCFITPLHDKSNFRFALYTEYKANRKNTRKPYHVENAHNYIKDRWKAEESYGEEADDTMSIYHMELNQFEFHPDICNSILCSIDKDFNNIPGWHYHPRKDILYFVTELEALKNFYLQILTGDDVDNIPRVRKGWLKAKTEKAINKALTEQELYDIIYTEVYKVFKKDFGYGEELDQKVNEFITLNGRLVWLRRKKEELWRPLMSAEKIA